MARKAVAMPIELAMKVRRSMRQLLRLLLGHRADQGLDLLLLRVLRPGDELLVGDHLGRDRRIDALVEVTLPLGNPHVADSLGFGASWSGV